MSRVQLPPRLWAGVATLIGILATFWAGRQVGGPDERLVLIVVVLGAMTIAFVAVPHWLIVFGALLVFLGNVSISGIPAPEVGALLIVIGVLGRKRGGWALPQLLVLTIPLLFTWILYVGLADLGDPDVFKRFASLSVWVGVLTAAALPGDGQRYIAAGLSLGLVASYPASLVFGSNYAGRWAGLVGDPNSFALVVIVVVPLISWEFRHSRIFSAGVWLLGGGLVWMSQSRTGIAAFVVALAVYIFLPHVRAWALGLPVLALFVAERLPDDFIQGGRFQDRVGSDELRERIDAASLRQIRENFWAGRGLSEGKVDLARYGDPPQNLSFFLHNSYRSLMTEVGAIGVGLYAVVAFGAIMHGLRGDVARGALAAIGATAVMATQLGEVLFAVPVALALGFAWGSPGYSSPPSGLAPALPIAESGPSRSGSQTVAKK